MTRTDAAIVLETALSSAPLRTLEQQAQSLVASKFPRLAAPAALETPKPDSPPPLQLAQSAPLQHESEATPEQEQTTTGITLAVSRPALPTLGDPNLWLQPLDEVKAQPQPARDESDSQPQASGVGTALTRWRAAGRRYWLGFSSGAAVTLVGAAACWMLWGAEHRAPPGESPTQASLAPPLAAAPIERVSPSTPRIESRVELPRGEETRIAAAFAAALSEGAAATSASDDKGAANRAGARRAAAAPKRAAASNKPAGKGAAEAPSSVPYDESKLKQIMSVAVQKAEQCDRWGRATGTAELFITFAPSGKVKGARLSGEPIASAPVARCILHHARANSLPPFAGSTFTVSRKITLR